MPLAQNVTGNAPIPESRCRTIAGHQAGATAVDEPAVRVPGPQRNAGAANPPSWERGEAERVVSRADQAPAVLPR